jgi:hypothetical protein
LPAERDKSICPGVTKTDTDRKIGIGTAPTTRHDGLGQETRATLSGDSIAATIPGIGIGIEIEIEIDRR